MRKAFIPYLRSKVSKSPSVNSALTINNSINLRKGFQMKEEKVVKTEVEAIKDDVKVVPTGSQRRNGKVNKQGKGRKQQPKQDKQVDAPSDKITESKAYGLNLFSGVPGVQLAGRHKYAVSHYEVNLMPAYPGNTAANVTMAHYDEDRGIRIGGEGFLRRVRQAAMAANSRFLNGIGNIDQLVNAFLTYVYNSRQLYSLLLTCWRCQNVVNSIDEDGRYLDPLFNNHQLKLATQGWSATSFATEVNYNTYANIANRQAMCFSTATSNGLWQNSVVAPILQYVRLPKLWRIWAERKFGSIHYALPTDVNASPRYVVLWPDGRMINPEDGTFIDFGGYAAHSATTVNIGNASVNPQFVAHINFFATFCSYQLNQYPQLEYMFDMLECAAGSFDFKRDLDGKRSMVKDSIDVTKFIASTTDGWYVVAVGSATPSTLQYYYDNNNTSYQWLRPNRLVIERDPDVQHHDLDSFTLGDKYASSNLSYRDRVVCDEAEYALCLHNVAPLSMTMLIHSTTNAFRWVLPLFVTLGNTYNPVGGLTAAQAIQAFNELTAMQTQQAYVLGRNRITFSANAFDASTGVPHSTDSTANYYYDLKDYLIPEVEADGWRNDIADSISGAFVN